MMTWQVYVYLVFIVIVSILGAIVQYKFFYTSEAEKEEKENNEKKEKSAHKEEESNEKLIKNENK